MIRKWTLRNGCEVTARRDENDTTFDWETREWVNCRYTLKYMMPKPSEFTYYLQIGVEFGGESWREVFKQLRKDMKYHPKPTARLTARGLEINPSRPVLHLVAPIVELKR